MSSQNMSQRPTAWTARHRGRTAIVPVYLVFKDHPEPPLSTYNLRIHRDGANHRGHIRAACPSRWRAIASGCKLPPAAREENS
ncbi:hypothetical protein KEM48_001928 [Puccinia striiformis f. sp. tritici PST-130]|nr:hypothetical protein KEM48_001928 [Puccinia striiformis f. sp. tritici PST-130]